MLKPSSRLAGVVSLAAATGLAVSVLACGDEGPAGPSGPSAPDRLVFTPSSVTLDPVTGASVELRNEGERAVGPVLLVPGQVRDEGGNARVGARVDVRPENIPTLNPDQSITVTLTPKLGDLPAGDYQVELDALVDADVLASLSLAVVLRPIAPPTPGSSTQAVVITGGAASPRQGDVRRYTAETRDGNGQPVADPGLIWFVVPSTAGFVAPDGRFVGYGPGPAQIFASANGHTDSLSIRVQARGGLSGSFQVVGNVDAGPRLGSDIWVHGGVAYTGTWRWITIGQTQLFGDRMYVWDISQPASPVRVDSVIVDARTVNDVKIRDDGLLAVISHELSNDGLNGVTLLDTTDPLRPTVVGRYAQNLAEGVHNVWIDGDILYVVRDNIGAGLHILDISNPAAPVEIARHFVGQSFLHDVYVRDGLAFLSQWDDGLVILDVGNGMAGGSPASPVEVGRVKTAGGNTHNAWYWPQAEVVFVGEEVDSGSPPGAMHVVDVSDMTDPREVATYYISSWTPHNFWLDETRQILYIAWYGDGVRALDVSGELLGELSKQGREIAWTRYGGTASSFVSPGLGGAVAGTPDPGKSGFGLMSAPGDTRTWAPQLHNGLIYLSDINRGVWVLRPNF